MPGYGQTEAAPVILQRPVRVKIDTVGPPLDRVALRIAEDGEILVTRQQCHEVLERPQATAQALVDGWLHTGDVGWIDPDGYICITDRPERDFIENRWRELSPARVEGYLTLEPEIAQAMVFGDRPPCFVAVVAPDPEFAAAFAPRMAPRRKSLRSPRSKISKAMGSVTRVNRALAPIERARRFVVATDPFTIANGQMTPTLKVKRLAIRDAYGAAIAGLYDGKGLAA